MPTLNSWKQEQEKEDKKMSGMLMGNSGKGTMREMGAWCVLWFPQIFSFITSQYFSTMEMFCIISISAYGWKMTLG